MPNASRFGRLGWLVLSVLVLVIDQVSKAHFEGSLEMFQQIVVIPDYFSWTLAYNTGAAFSFLADGGGWQRWLFALIAVVVSAVLVVWLKRLGRDDTWLAIALALVLGGALGNLYDRIALGHVIDFILVHWQNRWYFPAFNFADSAITVGAIMLALDMFKSKKPERPFMTDQVLAEQRIGQNTEVTLHFALRLENGDTVDSTFDKSPATFKVGDGNLLPGLKRPCSASRPATSAPCRSCRKTPLASPTRKRTDHPAFAVPGHGAVGRPAGDLQRCSEHRAAGCGQSLR